MGAPQITGILLGSPYNKDHNGLGSTLGTPIHVNYHILYLFRSHLMAGELKIQLGSGFHTGGLLLSS